MNLLSGRPHQRQVVFFTRRSKRHSQNANIKHSYRQISFLFFYSISCLVCFQIFPFDSLFSTLFLVFFFFHFLEDFSSVRSLFMYSQIPYELRNFLTSLTSTIVKIQAFWDVKRFDQQIFTVASKENCVPILRVRQSKKGFIFLGLFSMQLRTQFSYQLIINCNYCLQHLIIQTEVL